MRILRCVLLFFIYLFINFESSLFSVIYLTNNTGAGLQIAWLTKQEKLISSSDSILTSQINRQYTTPKNAAKFKVLWGGGSLSSNIINIIQNNYYVAVCLPDKYYCNQITLKNIGSQGSVKNNGKEKASSDSSNALSIYLNNTAKSELQINWLDTTGKILSSSVVANNPSQQAINIVPNAVSFTVSNKDKTVTSASTNQIAEEVYKISCTMVGKKCAQLIVTDSGSVNTFKVTRSANSSSTATNASTTKTAAATVAMPSRASGDGGSVDYSAGITNLNAMLPDYCPDGVTLQNADGSCPGSGGSSSDGSLSAGDGSSPTDGSGN